MSSTLILLTGCNKYRITSSKQAEVAEMKNHYLFMSLVVAIMVTMMAMANLWMTPLKMKPEMYGSIVPFYEIAEKITLNELIEAANEYNFNLYLPTKMPGNITLVAIYYKPPLIMLSYSDKEVKDYRYDKVTIEVYMGSQVPPSLEELKLTAEKEPNNQVFSINSARGILIENARWGDPELQELYGSSPFAYFWLGNHYYMISVVPPITSDQLIEIIQNMESLKS